MKRDNSRSRGASLRDHLVDGLGFSSGIGLAYAYGWSTTDLMWSLWLSSLVVGYATIVSATLFARKVGVVALAREGAETHGSDDAAAAVAALSVIAFAFVSLHFCAFHSAHAYFLERFFPLPGVSPGAHFAQSFLAPIGVWVDAWRFVAPQYWMFLISAVIAERRSFTRSPGVGKKQASYSRAYANVARMHVLLIFLGFCQAFHVDSFVVFAAAYAVYFFP